MREWCVPERSTTPLTFSHGTDCTFAACVPDEAWPRTRCRDGTDVHKDTTMLSLKVRRDNRSAVVEWRDVGLHDTIVFRFGNCWRRLYVRYEM